MFVGIDHGTVGIRFAVLDEGKAGRASVFELSRKKAAEIDTEGIIREIERGLEVKTEEIKLVALTYSMGDGFSTIKDINKVQNRGVKSEEGAGAKVGGGTKVFDTILAADIPTIMIPGIHAGSETIDRRMKFFSHCASPEKVGVAYHIYKKGFENFIFADISSNTVTMSVAEGKIIGAIDACLGSPGLYQGPIDLQRLREIDEGRITANEAFSNSGVLRKNWTNGSAGNEELAMDALSLFAAMEIAAMRVFMTDYGGVEAGEYKIFLTGSVGEREEIKQRIDQLLGINSEAVTITMYSAAIGCAEIARDVFYGAKRILGIEVEKNHKKIYF
ncbi:MAG: methanogenesis marker 12 protein [Methanophagales archaeon]|nr:methanogenesis marker 12 protein [Methanophagales archaeon]